MRRFSVAFYDLFNLGLRPTIKQSNKRQARHMHADELQLIICTWYLYAIVIESRACRPQQNYLQSRAAVWNLRPAKRTRCARSLLALALRPSAQTIRLVPSSALLPLPQKTEERAICGRAVAHKAINGSLDKPQL